MRLAFGLAAAVAIGAAALVWLQPDRASAHPAPALREPAPEFTGIETWLGSPPLRLADLRGKVVLVDFWTFGCSNCAHTLPDLARFHERYAAQGLVVVGVHTPEYAFERDVENVRAAVARFGIPYAVAIDNDYRTWTAYGTRYWPSVFLVDRDGRLAFAHAGDDGYDEVDAAIRKALAMPAS
jgi:thiol-disulfide isomerase/thioredoxin